MFWKPGPIFLVRGEGETTIPRLLAALREGQPGGVIEEDEPKMTISPVPQPKLYLKVKAPAQGF